MVKWSFLMLIDQLFEFGAQGIKANSKFNTFVIFGCLYWLHKYFHTYGCNNYSHLLYRHKCFTGKFTTCKIHMKLHPGPKWCIFHMLSSEDIDDVISCFFLVVCAKSQ